MNFPTSPSTAKTTHLELCSWLTLQEVKGMEKGNMGQPAALPISASILVNTLALLEELSLIKKRRWQDSLELAEIPGALSFINFPLTLIKALS